MQIGAGPDASPPGPRRQPWRPGPLAGRYPAAAAMVVLFLVPYLGLSSALQPLTPIIAGQLHMRAQEISLASGMANAGYAAGTCWPSRSPSTCPSGGCCWSTGCCW